MRTTRPLAGLLAGLLATGALAAAPSVTTTDAGATAPADGRGDVTVIAVVDSAMTPYHLDFRADRMPQHLDQDPTNDLPLDGPAPHEWIPDFPDPATAFGDYRALDLTLPESGPISAAYDADIAQWNGLQASNGAMANFYWAPGTKVVGMVDFSGSGFKLRGGAAHGVGSSSVSAGAIHGACPECVVVLLPYGSGSNREAASNWAYEQEWIDVVTNSFGFSLLLRDRYYNGDNAALSRAASERGQTIFFSAGNGQANTFTAPNTTLLSSQEGPDWMITVGAIDPRSEGSYTGHGKPVDIASIGTGYPSAPSSGNSNVDSEGTFGGTSNATPVTAGTYARALHLVRAALPGPSKTQTGGAIATGPAGCGAALADCALGDGVLTARELRDALFDTAVHTAAGFDPIGLVGGEPALPTTDDETTYMTEGKGSLFGRVHGDERWLAETGDTAALVLGDRAPTGSDPREDDWFVVDSWCRQQLWGEWADGDYQGELGTINPTAPLTETYAAACPALVELRP